MATARRLNIGFINSTIREDWAQAQWRGFLAGAASRGVATFSFIGGVLDDPQGFERQRNAIFSFAGKERLDGLVVWSGGINWYVDDARMRAFLDSFRPLPIVSIEAAYPGVPSLVMDDYAGMKAAVSHLIEAHGRKDIAFVRGPAGHTGMQKRYAAYVDALKEHGLAPRPELVSEPSGAIDCSTFLGGLVDRKIRFDAVAAANDDRARDALARLAARGLAVPRDVSVIGFDDAPWGKVTDPPLTSVHVPFSEVGAQAVATLERIIRGESVPPTQSFVPELVARQSCGCGLAAVEHIRVAPQRRHVANAEAARQAQERLAAAWSKAPRDSGAKLVSSLVEDVRTNGTRFPDVIAASLAGVSDPSDLFQTGQDLLTLVESAVPGNALPFGRAARASRLIERARVQVNELAVRKSGEALVRGEQLQTTIISAGQGIMSKFTMGDMLANIRTELPRLGITSFQLLRYRDAERRTAELLASREAAYPDGGPVVACARLAPEGELERGSVSDWLVLPLVFEDEQLGFLVAKADPTLATVYESFAALLGSAIKGALLVDRISAHDRAVSEGVRGLTEAMGELGSNIDRIGGSMDEQATAVEEEASAIEQLVRNIESISKFAEKSREFSDSLRRFAAENGAALGDTINLIKDVHAKSAKIGEVMALIKEVAEKTHILSLNAAIQAANAGAKGTAFTVVATEIRRLSEDTSGSIDTISAQVGQIMGSINTLTATTESLRSGLEGLMSMAEQNAQASVQLGNSLAEQTTGAYEIQQSANELLRITEEVKRAVGEQLSSTHAVESAIGRLREAR